MKTTIKAGVKSWKTTAIGVILAGSQLVGAEGFDPESLGTPQFWLLLALGFLMRDADTSSIKSGVEPEPMLENSDLNQKS